VLHYLPEADQEALLARIAAALEPGGVLLVREADADAGWRFTAVRVQERFSSLLRRGWRQRFHYRGAAEWEGILRGLGLAVEPHPMGMGTPYANVLLAARSRSRRRGRPGQADPPGPLGGR
jgi:O-methyltransferase involved in polyketide biosynthesis